MLEVCGQEYITGRVFAPQDEISRYLDGEATAVPKIGKMPFRLPVSKNGMNITAWQCPDNFLVPAKGDQPPTVNLKGIIKQVVSTGKAQVIGATDYCFDLSKKNTRGVCILPTSDDVNLIPFDISDTLTEVDIDDCRPLLEKVDELPSYRELPGNTDTLDYSPIMFKNEGRFDFMRERQRYFGSKLVDLRINFGHTSYQFEAVQVASNSKIVNKLNALSKALGNNTRFVIDDREVFSALDYLEMVRSRKYTLSGNGLTNYLHDRIYHGIDLLIPGAQQVQEEIITLSPDLSVEEIGEQLHRSQHYLRSVVRVTSDHKDSLSKTGVNMAECIRLLKCDYGRSQGYDGIAEPYILTYLKEKNNFFEAMSSLSTQE